MNKSKYNTIAFVSFENSLAPVGGLNAVMNKLPPIIAEKLKKMQIILITPFFYNIEKSRAALNEGIINSTGIKPTVQYREKNYKMEILEHCPFKKHENYKIYFVKSNEFFIAPENPYITPGNQNQLLEDSHFFCTTIPKVLSSINEKPPFLLNLQDWETALTLYTMEPSIQHKCLLTLHNPYDQKVKHLENLLKVKKNSTILKYTLKKMDIVSTVSEHFAYELTHEPLLTEILVPHLQKILKNIEIIGINNGNFKELNFPTIKNEDQILKKKREYRNEFIDDFLLQKETKLKPKWSSIINLEIKYPLFIIFGRNDPNQKGFDLAAAAIYKLLDEVGDDFARFIFLPIPGNYGINNLFYLKGLAEKFSKSIMIFPYRLPRGYMELQKSASYILMCSYYEPFGAAHEGYAVGVPVIARATGGLIQQVCPKNFGLLSNELKDIITKFHDLPLNPTGYLFRENERFNKKKFWKKIIHNNDSIKQTIDEIIRRDNLLFKSMVNSCKKVIEDAANLYISKPKEYADLIINGLKLFQKFSWHKSAERYLRDFYKIKISNI